MTIFISIPSYRDAELLPTLRDCFGKARWPDDLRVGLCWQHDETETLDVFAEDPRLRVDDVPYTESRGVSWARRRSATFYEGEDFVLHMDSHHRFVKDWDAKLIDMMGKAASSKPVLTAFPPAYDPAAGTFGDKATTTEFVGFAPNGTVIPRGETFPAGYDAPLPARLLAACLTFSIGRFIEDVPPDPDLYYSGEEASFGVRAFTHGYDLFSPNEIVSWHFYGRSDRPKHWDNHTAAAVRNAAEEWSTLEGRSVARFRRLLGIDPPDPTEDFGVYGLGAERTLRDYERFAGISYSAQAVEPHTLAHRPPPSPLSELDDETWSRLLVRAWRAEVPVEDRRRWTPGTGAPWILSLEWRNGDVQERPFTAAEMAEIRNRGRSTLSVRYFAPEPASAWTIFRQELFGGRVAIDAGPVPPGAKPWEQD